MKRLPRIIGSLLGLVVLGTLVTILALFLRGSEQVTETFAEAISNCVPPSTAQSKPEIRQPRSTPTSSKPIPTAVLPPALQRGSRVGLPTLVLGSDSRTRLGLTALSGKRAAVSITNADGWTCVFVGDINTGRAEQIASLRGNIQDLVISDQYAVWTDQTVEESSPPCTPKAPASAPGTALPLDQPCRSNPPQYRSELHVYDLQARREIDRRAGTYRFLNLSNDVLVWQDYFGIYGQSIANKQTFTVTLQSASYPKIAGDWIAYSIPQEGVNRMLTADLHLFSQRTKEDKVIGSVAAQADGAGYAIDGTWLAWMKIDGGQSTPPAYEVNVYSLATKQNRKIDVGNTIYPSPLLLSDGLLVYARDGWHAVDLKNGAQFDLFVSQSAIESVTSLKVSDNRLLWKMEDRVSRNIQLYTAQVIRPSAGTPYP